MNAINYLALYLSKTEQLGTDKKNNNNKNNYTDGLSLKELKTIDQNGDGVITEAEFKKIYKGKDATEIWNKYISYYNTKSTTNQDGTSTVTQTAKDGTQIQTSYDTNGKVTSYKTVSTNNNGEKITTTTLPNGSSTTYNNKTKAYTYKAADGTTTGTNSKGSITSLQTSNTTVDLSYQSNGTDLKSVKLDGTSYTNITSKDGNIMVKDDEGNVVLTMTTNTNGQTAVVKYKDGKKSEYIQLNSDKEPVSTGTYNKNGFTTRRVYCNTGFVRIYTRDSQGNLQSSTDYRNTADEKAGKKYSVQTYDTANGTKYFENNPDALWATRTYYDETGKNVISYQTYTYKKNSDNTVTQTTKTYTDNTKKTLKSTVTTEKNSYGNTLSSKTVNEQTGIISTTVYNYKSYVYDNNTSVNYKTAKVSNKHLESIITTTGNAQVTKTYENGIVKSQKSTSESDNNDSTKTSESKNSNTADTSNSNDGISKISAAKIIAYAKKFVGYNAKDGSADKFLYGGDADKTAWCSEFVEYVMKQSGYYNELPDWYTKNGTMDAFNRIYSAAKSANAIVSSNNAQAGDIILIDTDGDGKLNHTGLITKIKNGKVYTIEGNVGGKVVERSYSLTSKKLVFCKLTA